jgi:hypothetical protein
MYESDHHRHKPRAEGKHAFMPYAPASDLSPSYRIISFIKMAWKRRGHLTRRLATPRNAHTSISVHSQTLRLSVRFNQSEHLIRYESREPTPTLASSLTSLEGSNSPSIMHLGNLPTRRRSSSNIHSQMYFIDDLLVYNDVL